MKWVYRVVIPVFVVGIVAVCVVLFLQVNEAKAEIKDLNATVSSQETMINNTVADLHDTENRLQETEDKLQETEDQLLETRESLDESIQANTELEKEYNSTVSRLSSVENSLTAEKSRTSQLETEIENLQDELQLYYDMGIIVKSETVPPYRATTRPQYDLVNNPEAKNVSYQELRNFLFEDDTDKIPYIVDEYMCGEFAETLHNNAEESGIKAAFVGIQFKDGSIGHAFNGFITTDRGLIYIDVTGSQPGQARPTHLDRVVSTLEVGKARRAELLWNDGLWYLIPDYKIVSLIEVYW
jgi:membrane-associated HD superfamily phosphohydrolase